MQARLWLLPLVFFACLVRLVSAEPANVTEPTLEQLQLQISIMKDYIKKLEDDVKNNSRNADPVLEKAYIEAQRKKYEYLTAMMDVYISAFRAQQVASAVILCLVVLVVVSGVGFAGFQLWKGVSAAGVQVSSDLEFSASKVRLTSSVVGIVVLTISLVFLYIYTREVYQIRVIDSATTNLTSP